MAAFSHFLRALLPPLLTALILYLATTLLIFPFIRRHRTRYSPYLPMPTTLTTHASSWRTKLSDALYALFMPSTWRNPPTINVHSDSSSDFDDEDGEGMVGFDPVDDSRREALERIRRGGGAGAGAGDEERRLGRELEQGFRDESEDESGDESRRSMSASRR